MTYVLDASALIAHLDPADLHHEAATNVLLDAASHQLLVHHLNLAECLVGAVRADRSAAVLEAVSVMQLEVAEVDADSPLRLARLRVATGLRMPDCCALDVARHHDATLVTFDDRQRAAAQDIGVPVVP